MCLENEQHNTLALSRYAVRVYVERGRPGRPKSLQGKSLRQALCVACAIPPIEGTAHPYIPPLWGMNEHTFTSCMVGHGHDPILSASILTHDIVH